MSKATEKDRENFISKLYQHAGRDLGITETRHIAKIIMHNGATYSRIQEHACNAPDARYGQDEYNARMQRMWERKSARLEAKEKRIEERVTKLCALLNCKPVFNGDPRGATIKIAFPDGYADDWGREGLCVPTA